METNNEWVPGQDGWAEFCKANPVLALKGSRSSYIWFARSGHPEKLAALGAMAKTSTRRWLIHRPTFNKVAFNYFIKQSLEVAPQA